MLKGLEGWGAEGGTEEDSVEPGGWHRTTFSSWQGLGSSSWDQTEAREGNVCWSHGQISNWKTVTLVLCWVTDWRDQDEMWMAPSGASLGVQER